MTPEVVLDIGTQALQVLTVLVMIILLPALAVGLLVSVFQAATQVNEQTLSFIPKLLVTFGVIMFAGPWLLNLLVNYFQRLISGIPGVIG
ncbi:flagellar biosynthetic protein FliQ [Candidatus Tenderia electrophaga]|jgi:flagellar biosynthetic protein FliQ|uniref:Flagellar biosynthetic protein FliQ n=1 Tax=Candidatus Tenderia electrophaga TaxID=1748243 RepID=A0A0S2TC66_9GAMM|nr:flagellar biosynthetic protein FliQ [Candidatus Tenderia electrophaga]